MTNSSNIGAQGVSWTVFGAECLQCVFDLRWLIILAVVLIITDYWWGVRELAELRKKATTRAEKERHKFHFSQAGRRTLNKAVVNALQSIDAVENYDITQGYPAEVVFTPQRLAEMGK